jgi:predicted phosphodiesterase
MRYGVLSDIHANLAALEAALAYFRRLGVDGYLCAGDLVGYGPEPNECVERIAGLGARCVAGNHDLIALGELTSDRCIPLARESLAWTQEVLTGASRGYLAALPRRLELEGGLVMAHGSLDDPQCYVTKPAQAEEQLARLAGESPAARALILGHTHRPWAHRSGGESLSRGRVALGSGAPTLLNPGSVGQSRDLLSRARFLLLDLDRSEATFLSTAYDTGRCRASLRRCGLPPDSCHLRPNLLRAAASRARRLLLPSGT